MLTILQDGGFYRRMFHSTMTIGTTAVLLIIVPSLMVIMPTTWSYVIGNTRMPQLIQISFPDAFHPWKILMILRIDLPQICMFGLRMTSKSELPYDMRW